MIDDTMTQAEREAAPGFEDEVAKKRAKAASNGSAGDAPAGDADGQTLEERSKVQTREEEDGQAAFVWEHGRKVTFGSLIKRGTDIEYKVKFGGISVKGRGEPIPIESKDLMLVGRYVSGGMNFVPSHDDEGDVTKVTIYATLKPQGPPVDVKSPEGRLVLGNPNLYDAVSALLEDGVSADYVRGEVEKALSGAASE